MPEEAAPKRDGEPGVAEPSEPGAAAAQRPAPEPAGPEPAEQTQVIVPPADDTPTEPVSTAKPVPTTEPVSLGKPEIVKTNFYVKSEYLRHLSSQDADFFFVLCT